MNTDVILRAHTAFDLSLQEFKRLMAGFSLPTLSDAWEVSAEITDVAPLRWGPVAWGWLGTLPTRVPRCLTRPSQRSSSPVERSTSPARIRRPSLFSRVRREWRPQGKRGVA